ncbi:MAG: tetratricopeptide repeat protein, partial [Verrucomicrobia bacterium]|nr:tetratricopeptide repeat protein [Verrucomicrobiota bacterium]
MIPIARIAALILLTVAGSPLRAQTAVPRATPAPAPAEDVLSYADLLYSKEQYALAAQQYQVFIREQPQSPNLQIAWFRLGECYLKVNQVEDAVTTFNYLINTFRKGSFAGSAAYRLAVLRFNSKDYRNALAYFKVAKDELSDPAAKIQALFYYARSLQLTGQAKEALANFEEVMAGSPAAQNPFHERCLLETARLFFDLGDTAKSLERFQSLAASATTAEFREEAIVRGGLMAAEAGKPEESEKLLAEALKFPETSPWKALARFGAIFNAFTRDDHDRVIALYNTGAYTSGNSEDDSRAKMLLVVGHSFRIKGDNESALRLYTLVEGRFPQRPEGAEAGYRKLQILHQQGDAALPAAVKVYAERQAKTDPDSSFIDMAWLMAGEWHFAQAENSASGAGSEFAKKHYGDAAAAYRRVRAEKVDKKYLEARLYKQGWSEIESGDTSEGILTLSRFVQQHSQSALASSALAKRAMAYQSQEDHQFALGDYLDIAKRYPDSRELEFALQQTALIYAHLRKIPEMIQAYRDLLAKFPG